MTKPTNIQDHGWLAFDNLTDCAANIARYIGGQQNPASSAVTSNGTLALDASQSNVFNIVLTANVTGSTIINGVFGQQVTVQFVQGAGGSHTVSWPTAKYAAGTAPTTSTTAGYTDSVTYTYDGANWQETARSIGNH